MQRIRVAALAALLMLPAALAARGATAAPAAPKEAVCAVCGPRAGAGPEPVHSTREYRGRTYSFCEAACREEFGRDPARWAALAGDKPAAPRTGTPSREGGSEVPS